MNDKETVALIGGGHAFGKTHGACPAGAGPSPIDDPTNPWPGLCGTGKGRDTYTSGIEGPWTTTPTKWDNNYFKELLENTWAEAKGPGDKHQWHTVDGTKNIMMLTSDISLLHDPTNSYQKYVNLFANNVTELDDAFSHAWYKLTTRDMGPHSRCLGPFVPPPQPFQFPLPEPPKEYPNFDRVRKSINKVMTTSFPGSKPDVVQGRAYYGALFVHLAYESAVTFRSTDYVGGLNGARIRFSPEIEWQNNAGMDEVLKVLGSVKKQYKNLSWSDLIALAADVALSHTQSYKGDFCKGRTDASAGDASELLAENLTPAATIDQIKEYIDRSGLTVHEYIALQARPRSLTQYKRQGYTGIYSTSNISLLNNNFFKILLNNKWEKFTAGKLDQYKAKCSKTGAYIYMTPRDLALSWDPTFLAISQDFAQNDEEFYRVFSSAWRKLMIIDRFNGPVQNICNN